MGKSESRPLRQCSHRLDSVRSHRTPLQPHCLNGSHRTAVVVVVYDGAEPAAVVVVE